MFARLLSLTRFTILIPIFGAWLAALLALLLGGYEVVIALLAIPASISQHNQKMLVLDLVEAVDLFLLGTAFYLIALGLYELFIDENAPVPGWLVIHSLDDLKYKLLAVIVVVLGVQFLGQVLGWKGGVEILYSGGAIALVVAALAFFMKGKAKE